jgi:hypothetical protein
MWWGFFAFLTCKKKESHYIWQGNHMHHDIRIENQVPFQCVFSSGNSIIPNHTLLQNS